jgi:predicted nucleic acid-binding protein
MTWCFPEEATPATRALELEASGAQIVVPQHWWLEVTNVLYIAERKKRIGKAGIENFLTFLDSVNLEYAPPAADFSISEMLAFCSVHALTSYDAAYLELAVRRQLPLATLDKDLRSAARRLGVKTLGV